MGVRFVLVVCAAAKLKVGCARVAARGERHDMVVLQERGFPARAIRCPEHTAAAVSLPDLAPHRCGNVPAIPNHDAEARGLDTRAYFVRFR